METLRTNLVTAGIGVSSLSTLRDIAIAGDEDLARLPKSRVEIQFPVYVLETLPETALPQWEQLRALTVRTGYCPVILGSKRE